jgi:hypothetical protein
MMTVNGMPLGWLPIETAPNDGRAFLVVDSFRQQWICSKLDGRVMGIGEGVLALAKATAERATHWMPLPRAPEKSV